MSSGLLHCVRNDELWIIQRLLNNVAALLGALDFLLTAAMQPT